MPPKPLDKFTPKQRKTLETHLAEGCDSSAHCFERRVGIAFELKVTGARVHRWFETNCKRDDVPAVALKSKKAKTSPAAEYRIASVDQEQKTQTPPSRDKVRLMLASLKLPKEVQNMIVHEAFDGEGQ